MEVKTGSFIPKVILNLDSNKIANICIDCRTWPFAIDTDDGSFCSTIGIGINPVDTPVEVNEASKCRCKE
jgi:hypothetical protein